MDLTPYLQALSPSTVNKAFLPIAVNGKVALAVRGRFFLRCFYENFNERSHIGCAVTDEKSCLKYLTNQVFELLICTDQLEHGNGYELVRKAKKRQPRLKVIVLALTDEIPSEYANSPWLEAVVAETDIIREVKPLEAALLAVTERHCYRSPSLRLRELSSFKCPRLTPREYEVLDRLACGMTDKEIAEALVISEQTSRTYTKRLLKVLKVNNRIQAVLKGVRCGIIQI
ncbi:response regulator transcription factor [Synechococcus sp. M16CYN]|uniref:response regulator transcription factor n=1 Tax=Synechococcus sp. M16CYN TaxID=3103139 RepID=UPI00324740C9